MLHKYHDWTAILTLLWGNCSGAVSASYSSSTASSGVLTVTSGGSTDVVATINFIGHYVTSNFHTTSGSSGTVEILRPAGRRATA
jgi:hypothetical protein